LIVSAFNSVILIRLHFYKLRQR